MIISFNKFNGFQWSIAEGTVKEFLEYFNTTLKERYITGRYFPGIAKTTDLRKLKALKNQGFTFFVDHELAETNLYYEVK